MTAIEAALDRTREAMDALDDQDARLHAKLCECYSEAEAWSIRTYSAGSRPKTRLPRSDVKT